jgi:CO dehydrogenase/acetyl-CoA synthase epsilon subunit
MGHIHRVQEIYINQVLSAAKNFSNVKAIAMKEATSRSNNVFRKP